MRWFKHVTSRALQQLAAGVLALVLGSAAYSQVFFEAECGITGNVWTGAFDTAASEQVHIQNTVDRPFAPITGTQPIADLMQYTVTVPTPGTYDLYLLVANNGLNSINYSINNSTWFLIDIPDSVNAFTWRKADDLAGGGTYQHVVTTVANESVTLFFSYGEPNLRVDKFALLPDQSAVPTGQGTAVGGCFDFGDAPDTALNSNGAGNYTTLIGNTVPGPLHAVDTAPAVFIGTAPDTEVNALQTSDATGDGGDELANGSLPSLIVSDTSYSVTLDVTNNKNFNATLMAWIDFDNDGLFEESERADSNQTIGPSVGSTTSTLTWSGLSGLVAGNLFMRTRISTDPLFGSADNGGEDALSLNVAGDGEVEDYRLEVLSAAVCTYPTADGIWSLNGSVTDSSSNGWVPANNDLVAGDFSNSVFVSGASAPRFDTNTVNLDGDATGTNGTFLNQGFDQMTVIFWMKPTSFTGTQTIWDEGGGTNGVAIRLNGNNLEVRVADNNLDIDVVSVPFPQDNNWHHVGVVYQFNGATADVALYIDGNLVDSGNGHTSVMSDHSSPARLGSASGTAFGVNDFYTGYIDEVVYWTSAASGGVGGSANQSGNMAELAACHTPVMPLDYGDAPDSGAGTGTNNYETLAANGGPHHLLDAALFLGNVIGDADVDGSPAVTALGDDNGDGPLSGNDEGVAQLLSVGTAFTPILDTDTSYQIVIDVTNNTGAAANLLAWIDFDYSGTFDDTELASVTGGTVPSAGATTATLTWTVPPSVNTGSTYMRLRLTTDTLTDTLAAEDSRSRGYAGDGEVEDYRITIDSVTDFGDAPSSYGDASHVASANLFLGALKGDVESTTLLGGDAGVGADGDDAGGSDDEDSVTFFKSLHAAATSYRVTATVNNASGSTANLYAWIDFDGNGTFDQDERATLSDNPAFGGITGTGTNTVPSGASGTVFLDWASTPGIVNGDTFLRLRLTTDTIDNTLETTTQDDASFGGAASNGEVEDFAITVQDVDWGDAPDLANTNSNGADDYSTRADENGPSHVILSTLFLGDTAPDADSDGFEDGTDTTGTARDDDNGGDEGVAQLLTTGASFPVLNITDTSYTLNIDAFNNTGSTARVFAWIDFDRNGLFDEDELAGSAGAVVPSSGSIQTLALDWTSLTGLSVGPTYMRLRITTDTPSGTGAGEDERSLGALSDGEVEDYRITIGNLDYGDAPAPYKTLLVNNGPRHSISNNLYLGDSETGNVLNNVLTDLDIDGFVDGVDDTGIAGDDDIDDASNNADENLDDLISGAAVFPTLRTSSTSYTLNLNYNNQTGSAARIYAWIDFDQNGTFDVDEARDGLFGQGDSQVATLIWSSIPNDIKAGTTYARFRIASSPLTASGSGEDVRSLGFLSNGEVEDHQISIGGVDFGDAPSSYKTFLANAGPRHIIGAANLFIGTNPPDGDRDGFGNGVVVNANATDDDTKLTADEGISDLLSSGAAVFPTLNATDTNYSLSVDVTNLAGSAATLHAWIDFDNNGLFDSDERAFVAVPNATNNAPVVLNWTIPPGSTIGVSYARFRIRLDSDASTLPTGLATAGEVEDHQINISGTGSISGRVFEDVNYGGGAGRNYATANASFSATDVGTPATVELWASDGTSCIGASPLATTISDAGGNYSFSGATVAAPAVYCVRVVTNTVESNRAGFTPGLVPVQTFRAQSTNGIGTVNAVANEIGGRFPALADTAAGSFDINQTSTWSIASVGGTAITNLDFGFSFNTIVNTNASGQGSLDQFILNANALSNANIAQVGQTPLIDVSIFEIPTSDPNYNTSGQGEFTISPTSLLPTITAPLKLNGETQDGANCPTPLIELSGAAAPAGNGLTISAGGSLVRGFIINNWANAGVALSTANGNAIECSYIGTNAAGSSAAANNVGIDITGSNSNTVGGTFATQANVIAGNTTVGINIAANQNQVLRNNIGLGADDVSRVDNGSHGIAIVGSNNSVGNTSSNNSNVIAYSGADGINISGASSAGNSVRINSIYKNLGLGINLEGLAGIDGIDANDADTGPNTLLNAPVLNTPGTAISGNDLLIDATFELDSRSTPIYTLEIYASPVCNSGPDGLAQAAAAGEGYQFVGSFGITGTTVGTNAYTDTLAGVVSTLQGGVITAKLVEDGGDTSEFSNCIQVAAPQVISGTVFEDVRYGGGFGRSFSTANGVAAGSAVGVTATVELWAFDGLNCTGTGPLQAATTDGAGAYAFTTATLGAQYCVRVANSTVQSSRGNWVPGIVPIQTYQVNGVAATPQTGLVGGRSPRDVDSAPGVIDTIANDGVRTQSIAIIDGPAATGIDFGFNFSTVVNTRSSGQGSLRQFILNANTLAPFTGFQAGNRLSVTGITESFASAVPSGTETSIFMISNGLGNADGLASNTQNLLGGSDVAEISISATQTISRSNIAIDGTTQTINVTGNDNGAYNTGATVGRLATAQGEIRLPDVQLAGGGINVAAVNTQIRGIAFLPTTTALTVTADNASIEQNGFGVIAVSFSEPGSGSSADLVILNNADNGQLLNNAFGFGSQNGLQFGNGSTNWTINDNLWQGFSQAGITTVGNYACSSFERNRLTANNQGIAFSGGAGFGNCLVSNSTINQNTQSGINVNVAAGANISMIGNLITENGGDGVAVIGATSTQVLIIENHIFNNGDLGIDLENDNAVTTGEGGGANVHINVPVINSVTADGSNITVNVTATSAQSGLQVELYSNAVCNGNTAGASQLLQFGEGEKWHSPSNAAASGVPFDIVIPSNIDPLAGDIFTAIARDSAGNTSEFSQCVQGLFNDYGDAPDSYGTTLAANGARHLTNGAIFITTPADPEIDGLVTTDATGDDSAGTDDEDDIGFPLLTNTKVNYSFTVNNVFNNTGSNAQLTAWIDFDGNGTFDTDEAATITVSSSASTTRDFTLEWVESPTGGQGSIPIDITAGSTFVRIRLSTDTSVLTTSPSTSSPLGFAADGEVEDFQLVIVEGSDYGDAPDSYATNILNTGEGVGASHFQSGPVYLGLIAPDGDDDGAPSVGADGDDIVNDDEDGAEIKSGLSPGSSAYTLDVVVTNFTGSTVNLYGWLDANLDGNFGSAAGADTGEFAQVLSIPSGASSTQTLNWSGFTTGSLPANTGAVNTYLRLRVTSDTLPANGSGFSGSASDGEVEDYRIVVSEFDCDTIYGSFFDGGTGGTVDDIRIYDPGPGGAGNGTLGAILSTQTVGSNGTALDPINRRYYYYNSGTGNDIIHHFDGAVHTNSGSNLAADVGDANYNRSAFDPNGNLWYLESGLADGGPLVRYSVAANGSLTLNQPADVTIRDNGTNAVDVTTTVGGDIAFDIDSNMYLLTYDDTNATEYYIYRIDSLTTDPTATLLFQALTPVAGEQIAGAAFYTNDFVYLIGTQGAVFEWDLGQDILTRINDAVFGGTTFGSADLASCIFPTLRPAVTATKRVFNETNPGAPGFSPGDVLRYEIVFRNSGAVVSEQTAFTDAIPANTSYIQNTTFLNGVSVPDDASAMPFSVPAPAVGNINSPGQTTGRLFNDTTPGNINDNEAIVTFKVKVDTLTGFTEVCNQGSVEVVDVSTTSTTAGATVTVLTNDPSTGAPSDPTCLRKFSGYGIFGNVYEDLDVDGVFDSPTEQGLAGVTIVLRDNTAGTCTATTTAADGSYQFLPLELGGYTVYEAVGASLASPPCPPTTADPNGFVSSSSNILNVNIINDDVTGQNFGDVRPPLFTPNNGGIVQPGETVVYSHTLSPRTNGSVTFSIGENTIPVLAGWSVTMNNDLNCNGILENGEPSINSAIAVTEGVDLCILNRVTAPIGASAGNQHIATITANFDYPGSFVSNTLLNVIDTTSVVSADDGALLLIKTVENITATSDFFDGGIEQISNEGVPGDELLYRVKFQNVGNAPLTDIDIFDTTPAFTQLSLTIPANCEDGRGALASIPDQIPPGISSCTVTVDAGGVGNNPGYTGSIQWTLTGSLSPGEQGFVVFSVTID